MPPLDAKSKGDEAYDKNYFSGIGSGYSSGYAYVDAASRRFFLNQIRKIRESGKHGKVCEIGCAYGTFLEMLEDEGYEVYGTDISSHAISEASKRTNAPLKVHDIAAGLPFPGERFETIVCLETIEHIQFPEKALQNIHSSLVANGTLLLTTPNAQSYPWRRAFFGYTDPDNTHISVKSPKEWIELLNACGFSIVSFEITFYHGSEAGIKNLLLGALMRLMCSLNLGPKTEIVARKR